jgi:NitT/TauT family transport system substrate-binding protein
MGTLMMMLRAFVTAMMAIAVSLAMPAAAQTPVRLILDWAPQPHQSPWFIAQDKGYFAREGLAVTIDRGFGSGDAMGKVATGTYDIGLGDGNLLVQWNAQNPAQRMLMVYLYMDHGAHSLVTVKGRGINTLQDLAGKKIGRTTGDIIGPLWPAFRRMHGIDDSKIEWMSVTPQLRDTLLMQGQLDATGAFSSTTLFNLVGLGVPSDNVVVFQFAEHGFELMGNGLIVSAAWAEKNPDTLRRFLRATIAGVRDAFMDVPAAVAAVTKRDALLKPDVELARMRYMMKSNMATPQMVQNGLGEVAPERLARLTGFLAEAFEIKPAPAPSSFFTDAYLPPKAERQFPR